MSTRWNSQSGDAKAYIHRQELRFSYQKGHDIPAGVQNFHIVSALTQIPNRMDLQKIVQSMVDEFRELK